MKKTLALGPLLALLVLAGPGPAAAHTYSLTPSGDTSGVTDTAAIQGYLDRCATSDPGCRISLGPGQFWVKQLVAENFHGTLRGMGAQTTIVSPIEDLPVNPSPTMWDSYPTPAGGGNEWPVVLTFIGGNVKVADVGFRVLDDVPTTGWTDPSGVEVFHLWAVVMVTGESARSSIQRISVEGTPASSLPLGYNVLVGVQFMGHAGARLRGRHSVSSSHFETVAFGAEAWFLEKAEVTIGGGHREGNTFRNCQVCTDAGSASQSTIEIANNHITTEPGFSVGIGLWQYEADELSRFEARDNTINHLAAFGRGVCVGDYVRGAAGPVTQHAIVSHNEIDMGLGPAWGWQEAIGLTDAYGALVVGNTISGESTEDIGSYGATRCRILVNKLRSSSNPKILLDSETSHCLVVTDDPSTVQDDGTHNRIISPND